MIVEHKINNEHVGEIDDDLLHDQNEAGIAHHDDPKHHRRLIFQHHRPSEDY